MFAGIVYTGLSKDVGWSVAYVDLVVIFRVCHGCVSQFARVRREDKDPGILSVEGSKELAGLKGP